MGKGIESTAPLSATSMIDFKEGDWLKREAKYLTTMIIIRGWMRDEIITREELLLVDAKMQKKYHPRISGQLFL